MCLRLQRQREIQKINADPPVGHKIKRKFKEISYHLSKVLTKHEKYIQHCILDERNEYPKYVSNPKAQTDKHLRFMEKKRKIY